jgi:hypothetical protein
MVKTIQYLDRLVYISEVKQTLSAQGTTFKTVLIYMSDSQEIVTCLLAT